MHRRGLLLLAVVCLALCTFATSQDKPSSRTRICVYFGNSSGLNAMLPRTRKLFTQWMTTKKIEAIHLEHEMGAVGRNQRMSFSAEALREAADRECDFVARAELMQTSTLDPTGNTRGRDPAQSADPNFSPSFDQHYDIRIRYLLVRTGNPEPISANERNAVEVGPELRAIETVLERVAKSLLTDVKKASAE